MTGLILTSGEWRQDAVCANGAARQERQADPVASLKLAAIGPATRKAIFLNFTGSPVDVMAEEYVAESLVSALENQVTTGERILLARAKVARDVIPASLRELGAKVDVVEASRDHSSRVLSKAAGTDPV